MQVFISSQMGIPPWPDLREATRSAVMDVGYEVLDFEGFAPGPIEDGLGPGGLGEEAAKRADLAIVVVGKEISPPVKREVETLARRRPQPPVGFFFAKLEHRDPEVQMLWDNLRGRYKLATFGSPEELRSEVKAFLRAHAPAASLNLAAPRMISEERRELSPGSEVRYRWLLRKGERITVIAEAQGGQHHFHFALVPSREYVARTQSTWYYDFGIGGDKYTFHEEVLAMEHGYVYAVARRPWWFHVGSVTVRLSVLLS